jgi:hypothetical protein
LKIPPLKQKAVLRIRSINRMAQHEDQADARQGLRDKSRTFLAVDVLRRHLADRPKHLPLLGAAEEALVPLRPLLEVRVEEPNLLPA